MIWDYYLFISRGMDVKELNYYGYIFSGLIMSLWILLKQELIAINKQELILYYNNSLKLNEVWIVKTHNIFGGFTWRIKVKIGIC